MTNIIDVLFISIWEDGIEIATNAKYNTENGLVFDIESTEGVDEDGYEVQTLDEEVIELADGTRYIVEQERNEYFVIK